MGKINFKATSLPSTLNEGEFVVVDGVTYVGNASNEPTIFQAEEKYTSYEVGVLPTTVGATEGTIGAYFTSSGLLQKLKFESGNWVDVGEAISTIKYVDDKTSLFKYDELRFDARRKKPLVSFISDDGNEEDYTILKPIFDEKGVDIGIAIPGDSDFTSPAMTVSQIDELVSNGWEVLGHWNVGNLPDKTPAEQENVLSTTREVLEGHGWDVESYVPTQGEDGGPTDPSIRRLIRKYYRASFITRNEINNQPLPTYRILRVNVVNSTDPQPTLQDLKDKVDEAVTSDGWVVFTLHPRYATFDATQQQILSDLIDYIQSLNIDIVTPSEALNQVGNLLDIGDHGLSSGYYLTIDGSGRLFSNETGISYAQGDNTTKDLTPSDFSQKTVIRTILNADATGYPENSGGTLISIAYSPDFTWQKYNLINSNSEYVRYWDGSAWTSWVLSSGLEYAGTSAYSATDYRDEFPSKKVTVTDIGSGGTSGFPESAQGLLITYNYGNWTFQDYRLKNDGRIYSRYWDSTVTGASGFGEWGTWELSNVVSYTGSNSYSNATLRTDFSNKRIHVNEVASGNTTGFPNGDFGLLISYIFGNWSFQDYYVYRTNKVYTRNWDGTAWTSWELKAGGASGSFTSSDSKTVTVENGIITSIV